MAFEEVARDDAAHAGGRAGHDQVAGPELSAVLLLTAAAALLFPHVPRLLGRGPRLVFRAADD